MGNVVESIPIIGDVYKAIVKPVLNAVGSVLKAIVQPFMGLFGGMPDIPDVRAEANRQQGILIQQQGGGTVNIPVVYGFRKVAGTVTFAETADTNNRYLYVAYVFSEGPVEGLFDVWLQDDQIVDQAFIQGLNAGREMSIVADNKGSIMDKYAGRVTMRWSHGRYIDNPATSTLGSSLKTGMFAGAPNWENRMVYNGLATMFVRYEWKEINTPEDSKKNPFTGNLPTLQVTLMGRKVAPILARSGTGAPIINYSTTTLPSGVIQYSVSSLHAGMNNWGNGYAGSYGNFGGTYTERYSTNPAEILLDYLRNPRYGKGLRENEIDLQAFAIAAAKFETRVDYTTGTALSGVVNQINRTVLAPGPILECNYVLDTAQSIMANVKNLLQNARSYMPYVQGRYKLKVEDAGHPTLIAGPGSGVATIVAEATSDYFATGYSGANQYDIIGDIVFNSVDRTNKYNQVVVTYVEPENKWSNQQAIFPLTEADRLFYQNLDGGRENKQEVTMSAITNYSMALDMARLLFWKSRYQETCSLKVASQAFELEPGDIIRIKSRILNFENTPWRVVGIEYNQDCTFNLSCVRNEDYLYPYVPYNEPDYVLPLFIPKGVSSHYPIETFRLGYTPPRQAVYPPGHVATADNPGGTTTPVAPVAPVAPLEAPKDDFLDITSVEYIDRNGLTYARLNCVQPNNPMYKGVDIYWRLLAGTDTYQILRDTTAPGVRRAFTIDLGPLAVVASLAASANGYQALIRVRYTTEETSSRFTRITLNPATRALVGVNPSEVAEFVSTAWPTITLLSASAQAQVRNNKIDLVRANLTTSSGNARVMTFSITQDVRTQDINYNIAGCNVYYKSSSETYWNVHKATFGPYAPGAWVTFPFVGDIGNYGGSRYYGFVFRLTYKDGGESTFQSSFNVDFWSAEGSVTNEPVEPNPFNPSSRGYTGGDGTGMNLEITRFPLQTYDQAPPGSVVDRRNVKIGIMSIAAAGTETNNLTRIVLWSPPAAERDFLRGFRVRYRPVAPGQDPTLTEITVKPPWKSWTESAGTVITNGIFDFTMSDLRWGDRYEIIITPIVFFNGAQVEGNFSLFGSGYVTTNTVDGLYPRAPTNNTDQVRENNFGRNWISLFNFQNLDTKTALNLADQPFAAQNPTIDVISCIAYKRSWESWWQDERRVPIQDGILLTLNADKIADFRSVTVYRRHFRNNPGVHGGTNPDASYYGVGRWEKVQFWRGGDNAPGTSSGNFAVALKLPSDFREFSQYFGTARTATPAYTLTEGFGSREGYPNGLVLICNSTQLAEIQLLVVVNYGNASSPTESGYGVLIQGQPMDFTTGRSNFLQNATGAIRPKIVDLSLEPNIRPGDFPDIAGSSSLRKLSDARVISVKNNSGLPGATPTTQEVNLDFTAYYPSDYPTDSYFAYTAFNNRRILRWTLWGQYIGFTQAQGWPRLVGPDAVFTANGVYKGGAVGYDNVLR